MTFITKLYSYKKHNPLTLATGTENSVKSGRLHLAFIAMLFMGTCGSIQAAPPPAHTTTFQDLPHDVKGEIAKHLDVPGRGDLARVSRENREAVNAFRSDPLMKPYLELRKGEYHEIALPASPWMGVLSKDGKRLFVLNNDWPDAPGSLSVIDTTTNTVVGKPIPLPLNQTSYNAVLNHKGNLLYVLDKKSNIFIVDTQKLVVSHTIPLGNTAFPNAAIVSHDDSQLFVFGANDMFVIDTTSNKIVDRIHLNQAESAALLSPDGQHLVLAEGHFVSVIEAHNIENVIKSVDMKKPVIGFAWSHNGKQLFVLLEDEVVTLDAANKYHVIGMPITLPKKITRAPVKMTGTQSPFENIVLSPDGKRLAVLDHGKKSQIIIIDMTTQAIVGQPIRLPAVPNTPYLATWADKDNLFATVPNLDALFRVKVPSLELTGWKIPSTGSHTKPLYLLVDREIKHLFVFNQMNKTVGVFDLHYL